MAGSHRAPRGGGRAAAREARRQKARKRNQTIAAGSRGRGAGRRRRSRGAERVRRRQTRPARRSAAARPTTSRPTANMLADDKVLLDAATAKPLAATGAWAVAKTADGSSAPEKAFVCQSQRFADPAGLRTWVRTFQNATTKDTAVQYVEVSNDKAAAGKAYTSIVGWLSQCSAPQTRLTSSYVTTGVGERGVIAVFGQPSGTKTTVQDDRGHAGRPGHDGARARHHRRYAAQAGRRSWPRRAPRLKRICAQSGGCGTGAPVARPALLPTTEAPGFMAPVDLPVLDEHRQAVGQQRRHQDRRGTGCEKINLKKAKATKYGTHDLRDAGGEGADRVRPGRHGREVRHPGRGERLRRPRSARTSTAARRRVSNAKVKSTGTIATSRSRARAGGRRTTPAAGRSSPTGSASPGPGTARSTCCSRC